jgi:hypothetical protein
MDTNIVSAWLKKQLLETGSGFVPVGIDINYFHLMSSTDSAEPASRTLCFFNQSEKMDTVECECQHSIVACCPYTIRGGFIKGDSHI